MSAKNQNAPTWTAPQEDIERPAFNPEQWSAPTEDVQRAERDAYIKKITNPTYGSSNFENFRAGAGKAIHDLGFGIQQHGAQLGNRLGMVSQKTVDELQKEADEEKERDASLMGTKAGIAGNIVGNTIPMTLFPTSGLAGAGLSGVAAGLLEPTTSSGEGSSQIQNAAVGALGGVGGHLVGSGISAGLSAFSRSVAPARQKLIEKLNEAYKAALDAAPHLDRESLQRTAIGKALKTAYQSVVGSGQQFPLSIAQRTGSKIPLHIERASAITSDAPRDFYATQAPAFNRTVLHTLGEHEPNSEGVFAATPDVLGRAHARITGVMDDIADRTNAPFDEAFHQDMANFESSIPLMVQESEAAPLYRQMHDILEAASKNDGSLGGHVFQKANTNLSKLAANNPALSPLAQELRGIIRTHVAKYASEEDVDALRIAQQQYRVLKQIQPAVDPVTGNISPAALMRKINEQKNANQSLLGRGDQSLPDIARAGKGLLTDPLGNSGTAERQSLPELLASAHPFQALGQAVTGKMVMDPLGSAMRSQGLVGSYLTKGIPGLRALSPAIEKLDAPIGYGVMTGLGNSDETEKNRPTIPFTKIPLGTYPSTKGFSDINSSSDDEPISDTKTNRSEPMARPSENNQPVDQNLRQANFKSEDEPVDFSQFPRIEISHGDERPVDPSERLYAPPNDQGPSTTESAYGGRIERASGGSVNKHERLVNRLMTMASSAKKTSDKNTEQLLNVPDESIVKALDVAQQAI